MDEVYRSARRVRSMHSVVNGFARDGLDFDADDPHQQAWVSMTLTDSILVMAARYGSGRMSTEPAAQVVKEQSTSGALLDPRVDLDATFRDPHRRLALPAGEVPLRSEECRWGSE